MNKKRKYQVILDHIVWDIKEEKYDYSDLPNRVTVTLFGCDEDNAMYLAMDATSEEFGIHLKSAYAQVTKL